jgi:tetratricopeptide (TPR) repeat protein
MAAEPFLGIDFGTCNSSMAWFDPRTGQAEVLRNAEGEDKTPSVVYFGDREVLVGRHAEDRLESPEERKRVLPAVKRDLARPRLWVFGGRRVTPVEAAAEILKKLRHDAEEGHFHEPVRRAVITHPAVFDEAEKDKLREAAVLAGLQEVELLEEPVAAALAYARAGVKVGRHVLVYDLGGGTFDLALLAREEDEDVYRLALEPRGERVGGEDFDRAIYDHFDARIREKLEQEVCPGGVDLQLLRQCRRYKESLTASEHPTPFSFHWQGKGRLELKLSRSTFESRIEKRVERTLALTQSLREEAVAAGYEVDSVILIGGSSRVPLIVRRLQEALVLEPRKWQKQDLAVALGAACYAQQLWGAKGTPPTGPVAPSPSSVSSSAPLQGPGTEAAGLFAHALADFEEARTLEGELAEEKRLLRRQRVESARQYAQAASDLERQWGDPYVLKGHLLQERGEWLLAAAAYTAGLRCDPGSVQAYAGRGFCRLMAGEHAGARQDYDEVIRRGPSETAYRCRAAAALAVGDAAAAVSDIRQGLALGELEAPRAALLAVAGLLLRDELGSPEQSIACFAEALELLPAKTSPPEQTRFTTICKLFGLNDRVVVEPAAGAPDVRLVRPDPSLQRALWKACKSVNGDDARAAAAAFLSRNHRAVDEGLWKAEPDFALHLASIWAEKGHASKTMDWLKNLLLARPAFDIRVARRDPWIARLRDPALDDFLTPKWSFEEQHGLLFNHLTVENLSPFCLTSVVVRVVVTRSNRATDAQKTLRLASLGAGASRRWDNVFKDGGWLGGNIAGVRVALECAEGTAKQASRSSIVICCPSCGRKLRASSDQLGQELKCPTCAGIFTAGEDLPEVLPADGVPEVEPVPTNKAPAEPCPSCGTPRNGTQAWCDSCDYLFPLETAPRAAAGAPVVAASEAPPASTAASSRELPDWLAQMLASKAPATNSADPNAPRPAAGCPRCGLAHKWSGQWCGHCGYHL